MTHDATTDAALVIAPVPTLTHDDVQRMIDTQMSEVHTDVESQLRNTEARLTTATDERLTALEITLKQQLEEAIKPLRIELSARTTRDEARAIADEQMRPLRDDMANLRRDTDTGFKRLEDLIAGVSRALGAIADVPTRLTGIESALGAWTSMRSAQDEMRAKEIAEIRADERALAERVSTHISVITPAFTNMNNDLYGLPGGQTGIVAMTHQSHDLLIRVQDAITNLQDGVTKAIQAQVEDRSRLTSVEGGLSTVTTYIEGEKARRATWANIRKQIALFAGKSMLNRVALVVGGAAAVALFGLFGIVNMEQIAKLLGELFGVH